MPLPDHLSVNYHINFSKGSRSRQMSGKFTQDGKLFVFSFPCQARYQFVWAKMLGRNLNDVENVLLNHFTYFRNSSV